MDGARLRDDRLALLLLGVGLLVRMLFFAEVAGKGVDLRDRINIDTYMYHRTAVHVVEGDVLMRDRYEYSGKYPDVPGAPRLTTPIQILGLEVYDRTYERNAYFDYPGYSYFVAAFYAVFGEQTTLVYLAQLLLDLGACALVYGIALRVADRTVARVALALVVFDGPVIFHAGFLLRDSLLGSIGVALVALALRAEESERPFACAALGALSGVAWIMKGSMVLLLPVLLPLAVVGRGGRLEGRRLATRSAAFALGGVAAIAPFVARNVALGDAPLRMSTQEPAIILMDNLPNAGLRGASYDIPASHAAAAKMRTVSSLEALRVAVAEHPSWTGAPLQAAVRVANLYRADDPWDNVRHSWIAPCLGSMALAPVRFKLFAAFVPLGLVLALRDWKRSAPLFAPLLAMVFMGAIATCLTRYRMNADFAHAILAASAAVWLVRSARARRPASLVGAASVLVASLAFHDPVPPPTRAQIESYVRGTFPRAAAVLLERLERA